MNIKERENQLSFSLNFQIILSVLLWFAAISYMGYRLWNIRELPESPLAITNNVPTVRQANIDILQTSVKQITVSNLPVVRTEPFD